MTHPAAHPTVAQAAAAVLSAVLARAAALLLLALVVLAGQATAAEVSLGYGDTVSLRCCHSPVAAAELAAKGKRDCARLPVLLLPCCVRWPTRSRLAEQNQALHSHAAPCRPMRHI